MSWKMKEVLLLCYITLIARGTIIQTEYGLEKKLSNALVTLSLFKSVNVDEGTFCVKFYLLKNWGKYVIFSTTSGLNSFSLFFNMLENYGFVHFPKKSYLFVMQNVWPYEWFHFCFTYSKDEYHAVTNGKIWDSRPILTKHDNSEYYFIESLTIASTNTGYMLFPGRISHLNIWNYTMEIDDLISITTSCSEYPKKPNILKWTMVKKDQFTITNNKLAQFLDGNVCSSINKAKFKLYLALDEFEGSKHNCEKAGAVMYFPKNKDELTKIRNASSKSTYYKECGTAWLPIYLNDDGEWVDNSKQLLPRTQLIWKKGEPNGGGLQKCAKTYPSFTFVDAFCSSQACAICKWEKNPVFYLKGLCSISNIDYQYVLRVDQLYRGNIAFTGFSNDYFIVFDDNKQTYVLAKSIDMNNPYESIDDKTIGLPISLASNDEPIGLQMWRLNDGLCNQTLQLKFTHVRL